MRSVGSDVVVAAAAQNPVLPQWHERADCASHARGPNASRTQLLGLLRLQLQAALVDSLALRVGQLGHFL